MTKFVLRTAFILGLITIACSVAYKMGQLNASYTMKFVKYMPPLESLQESGYQTWVCTTGDYGK